MLMVCFQPSKAIQTRLRSPKQYRDRLTHVNTLVLGATCPRLLEILLQGGLRSGASPRNTPPHNNSCLLGCYVTKSRNCYFLL